jgi:hypothetical protein
VTEPVLTQQDRGSATWQKVERYLDDQITKMRAKNDADLSPDKTARLRGYIACLKAVKSLNSDAPAAPDEDRLFKNLE